jgi:hypothetical protein
MSDKISKGNQLNQNTNIRLQERTAPTSHREHLSKIPADAPWCPIRKAVCSWTNAKFPFRTDQQWGFYLLRRPVVTVIGKAFYDIDHSVKNPRRNRRNYDSSLAVWEIHPAMRLIQSVGPVF